MTTMVSDFNPLCTIGTATLGSASSAGTMHAELLCILAATARPSPYFAGAASEYDVDGTLMATSM